MATKYTKELLEPLVAKNVSVAGVLRDLGKNQTGSIHTHLSRVIRKLGIDTSHFKGQAANCGPDHRGGPGKTPWQEVLVDNQTRDTRERAFRLRRALIESGRPYKCERCGTGGIWLGQELRLQVDHKDKDWRNNTPENLRLLCPNCHSQTPGHSGSRGLTSVTSVAEASREQRRRRKYAQVMERETCSIEGAVAKRSCEFDPRLAHQSYSKRPELCGGT